MKNKYGVYLTIEQLRMVQITLISRLSAYNKEQRLSFYLDEKSMNDAWKALELITESINEAEGEEDSQ